MIRLAFLTGQRKILRFHIDGPKVIYFDDVWPNGVQIYPKDEAIIKKLIKSGKPNLQVLAAMLLDANKGEDLKQYLSCEGNEEEIARFVIRDCLGKGLRKI